MIACAHFATAETAGTNGDGGGVLVSISFLEGESRGNVDGDGLCANSVRFDADTRCNILPVSINDTTETDLIDICNTTPDS